MLSFQRRDVYPRAIEFLALVGDIVGDLPKGHAERADPLVRAAESVLRNIAEEPGAGRSFMTSSEGTLRTRNSSSRGRRRHADKDDLSVNVRNVQVHVVVAVNDDVDVNVDVDVYVNRLGCSSDLAVNRSIPLCRRY